MKKKLSLFRNHDIISLTLPSKTIVSAKKSFDITKFAYRYLSFNCSNRRSFFVFVLSKIPVCLFIGIATKLSVQGN